MKRLCALVLAFALGFAFAIPGLAQDTFSIAGWGSDESLSALQDAFSYYMRKDRGFTVSMHWQSERDPHFQFVDQSIQSDFPLDLALLDARMLQELGGDAFYSAEELFDARFLSDYTALGLWSATVDGRLCGIPLSMNSHIFFWNPESLKQRKADLPQSETDLLQLRKMVGTEAYPLAASAEGRIALLITFLQSFYGKAWLDPTTGKPAFSQQEVAEGFRALLRWEQEGIWPPLQEQEDLVEGFTQGKYLGLWAWDSQCTAITSALPPKTKLTFTAALTNWEPYAGGFQKPCSILTIPSACSDPQRAASLAVYLLTDSQGARRLADHFGTPANTTGRAEAHALRTLNGALSQANQIAQSWARYPMPSGFDDPLRCGSGGLYERLLLGLTDGSFTLDEAATLLLQEF